MVNWELPLITWVLFTKIEATKLPPIMTIAIVIRTACSWLMPRLLLKQLRLDIVGRRVRLQEFLSNEDENRHATA